MDSGTAGGMRYAVGPRSPRNRVDVAGGEIGPRRNERPGASRHGVDVGGGEIGLGRNERPRTAKGGVDVSGRVAGGFQVRSRWIGYSRSGLVVLDRASV